MSNKKPLITARDLFGKDFQVSGENLIWRPSAYGIIFKDGKVLLSKQFGERYDLPGGRVEVDEMLEAAVIREIKEETGLEAAINKYVAMRENFFIWKETDVYHSLLFYYLCDVTGGSLSTDHLEDYEREYTEMAEWIPLSEIDNIIPASSVDFRPIVKLAAKDLN